MFNYFYRLRSAALASILVATLAIPAFAQSVRPGPAGSSLTPLRAIVRLPGFKTPAIQEPGALLVGQSRAVDAEEVLRTGVWEMAPDGRRIWRVAIQSPDAQGLRLHFNSFNVGSGQVFVYSQDHPETALEPLTGAGPFGDGDVRSGMILGDTIVVEYVGGDGEIVPFRIDEVTHVFRSVAEMQAEFRSRTATPMIPGPSINGENADSASCHLDANCYAEWNESARSVAAIMFQNADGKSYFCSGALVDNPWHRLYFLTANHCLTGEVEARSVVTFWRFETIACNATKVTAPSALPQQTGSRMLAKGGWDAGDFSLVELATAIPASAQAMFSRVSATVPSLSETLTGIHHPAGTWKRISFGRGLTGETNYYLPLQWSQGLIEGGSSGSPLFNQAHEVVGIMSYGAGDGAGNLLTACTAMKVYYGRISSFYAALAPFLTTAGKGTAAPILKGIVNAASYSARIAPGSLISIFGQNLATQIQTVTALPYPTSLAGVSMSVNGVAVPIWYASPTQINAQLPFEANPGSAVLTITTASGRATQLLQIDGAAPGIFTSDGKVALSYRQGDWATIYVTGQGALKTRIATGAVAPTTYLIYPQYDVHVYSGTVKLRSAAVMAPGYLGLLQVNIQLPAGTAANFYNLRVEIGNASSQETLLNWR